MRDVRVADAIASSADAYTWQRTTSPPRTRHTHPVEPDTTRAGERALTRPVTSTWSPSTLADRILELTGAVDPRDHRPQLLDSMDLERERGITIKAQAVRVEYNASDGQLYRLHLIDTPGHVDFTYEVSRSLAACNGALLLVDAAQGVEAQTVANTYLAVDSGLELIPALNKIDLPGAEPERVAGEIHELLGEDEVIQISAKSGKGVEELLESLVTRVPPPEGDAAAPARALIFDSEFDQYRGVVAYIRVVDGELR